MHRNNFLYGILYKCTIESDCDGSSKSASASCSSGTDGGFGGDSYDIMIDHPYYSVMWCLKRYFRHSEM